LDLPNWPLANASRWASSKRNTTATQEAVTKIGHCRMSWTRIIVQYGDVCGEGPSIEEL
jgi:hypothetical protein